MHTEIAEALGLAPEARPDQITDAIRRRAAYTEGLETTIAALIEAMGNPQDGLAYALGYAQHLAFADRISDAARARYVDGFVAVLTEHATKALEADRLRAVLADMFRREVG